MAGELSAADLEAQAAAAGVRLTPALRQAWHHAGVLPQPRQKGKRGGGSISVYPAGTDAQLAALLHLRRTTHSWRALRFWLWWDGYPVPWALVRNDLVALQDAIVASQKEPIDDTQIAGIAATLAGQTKRYGLRARTKGAELTAALHLVLHLGIRGTLPVGRGELPGENGTAGSVLDRTFDFDGAVPPGTPVVDTDDAARVAVQAGAFDAERVSAVLAQCTAEDAENARQQLRPVVTEGLGRVFDLRPTRQGTTAVMGVLSTALYAMHVPSFVQQLQALPSRSADSS